MTRQATKRFFVGKLVLCVAVGTRSHLYLPSAIIFASTRSFGHQTLPATTTCIHTQAQPNTYVRRHTSLQSHYPPFHSQGPSHLPILTINSLCQRSANHGHLFQRHFILPASRVWQTRGYPVHPSPVQGAGQRVEEHVGGRKWPGNECR